MTVDLDAAHYRKNSKSQYTQANSLLKDVEIRCSFSILDVGCGHGEIIAELSRLIPKGRAVGVDPSRNMIHLASEAFSESSYRNLEFYRTKAEEMDFPPETFDLIICTNAFMWIREPQKTLDLMNGFLKSGGHLIIFTYDKDTPYVRLFESVLCKYYPELADSSAVNTMLSIEEYKSYLSKNQMHLDRFELEDIVFRYRNEEEFKNYIRGWLSCYASIPRDRQEEFINKIIENSGDVSISATKQEIIIPHRTLSIKASKC